MSNKVVSIRKYHKSSSSSSGNSGASSSNAPAYIPYIHPDTPYIRHVTDMDKESWARIDQIFMEDGTTHVDHATKANDAMYAQDAEHAKSAWDVDPNSPFRQIVAMIQENEQIAGEWVFEQLLELQRGWKTSHYLGGALGAGAAATIDINGQANLETDNLLVRGQMRVLELIIQRMKHQGGVAIWSPASCIASRVVDGGPYWRIYFDTSDGITVQEFIVHDQVRCQSYSGGEVNKNYWARITSLGDDYINISKSDFAGTLEPAVGDHLVQMGNRTNTSRQAAIEIASVGDDAPRISIYDAINSYTLTGKRVVNLGKGTDGRMNIRVERGEFNNVLIGGDASWPAMDQKIEQRTPYTLNLSCDNVSIPCDQMGKPLVALPTTYVSLYMGTTLVTEGVTWEKVIDGMTITSGPSMYTVTSLTKELATLKITAKIEGKIVATATFTVSKVLAGVDGQTPIIMELMPEHAVISRSGELFTPSTTSCKAKLIVGGESELVGIDTPIDYKGRNLFLKSKNRVFNNNSNAWYFERYDDKPFPFTFDKLLGKTVSISFDYDVSGLTTGDVAVQLFALYADGSTLNHLIRLLSDGKGRASQSYQIANKQLKPLADRNGYLAIAGNNNADARISITNVKVEFDTPTPYSPAPEDVVVTRNGAPYTIGSPYTLQAADSEIKWALSWNNQSDTERVPIIKDGRDGVDASADLAEALEMGNLIKNGGFYEGINHWRSKDGIVRVGSRNMIQASISGDAFSPTFNIPKSGSYALSFIAKTPSNIGTVKQMYVSIGNDTIGYQTRTVVLTTTQKPTSLGELFTVKFDLVANQSLVIVFNGPGVIAYITDVRLNYKQDIGFTPHKDDTPRSTVYLTESLRESTSVDGGLISSSLMILGSGDTERAGIDGTSSKVGMFLGGSYQQAVSDAELGIEVAKRQASTMLRKDGAGHFAGGKLRWDGMGRLLVGKSRVTDRGFEIGNGVVFSDNSVDDFDSFGTDFSLEEWAFGDLTTKGSPNSQSQYRDIEVKRGTYNVNILARISNTLRIDNAYISGIRPTPPAVTGAKCAIRNSIAFQLISGSIDNFSTIFKGMDQTINIDADLEGEDIGRYRMPPMGNLPAQEVRYSTGKLVREVGFELVDQVITVEHDTIIRITASYNTLSFTSNNTVDITNDPEYPQILPDLLNEYEMYQVDGVSSGAFSAVCKDGVVISDERGAVFKVKNSGGVINITTKGLPTSPEGLQQGEVYNHGGSLVVNEAMPAASILCGYMVNGDTTIDKRYGVKAKPTGNATKNGTGRYKVPHDIGHSNYIANINPLWDTTAIASVVNTGVNSVEIAIVNYNGMAIDCSFHITMVG